MNQYQRLIDNLTKLNLNNMAASIADYRQKVNDSQISFSEALLELTDKEIAYQRQESLKRRIKRARFPIVKRLSDSEDRIPVMVSERLVDVTQDYIGEYVEIHGQFRSYNRHEEKHNRLVLSVFSRELKFVEEEDETVPVNQIFLDGYICKPPVYRKTPLGREIADVLLAVNRPYGKSDYIPCICWGRNARYASAFEVGGHVLIWGRIQSREYMKRIGENETEKRVAYEVSVSKLEYME